MSLTQLSLAQRWMLGVGLLVSIAAIPFTAAEDTKPAANKPKELKSTAHLDGLSNWASSVAF